MVPSENRKDGPHMFNRAATAITRETHAIMQKHSAASVEATLQSAVSALMTDSVFTPNSLTFDVATYRT